LDSNFAHVDKLWITLKIFEINF